MIHMNKSKKAEVVIILVPEADKQKNRRLALDIKESLHCDWLAEIEKVTVKNET